MLRCWARAAAAPRAARAARAAAPRPRPALAAASAARRARAPAPWRALITESARRRLLQLEAAADARPADAPVQQSLCSQLFAAKLYRQLVLRVESERFASDAQTAKLYLLSLSRLGRLSSLSHAHFARLAEQSGLAPGRSAAAAVAPHAARDPLAAAAAARGGGVLHLREVVDNSGGTGRRALNLLLHALGWAAFVAVAYFLLQRFGPGQDVKSLFGKVDAEVAQEVNVKFDDVKGCDEAKDELREIVEFLSAPERFSRLGGKLPKGALLVGPPGTGKTLLAKAVAGEAGVPFFSVSGSQFEELYVGVGARRVRELFEQAKKKAPCLIFIDEIDAVGGRRSHGSSAGRSLSMTLNQLLSEMDGFEGDDGVVVLGATNFDKVLDTALTRPGRFDRRVEVPLPDVRGREQILDMYLGRVKVGDDASAKLLARGTAGCSGADLRNLVNTAAVRASRLGDDRVGMAHLEYAKDRVLMGSERKSAVMSERDRRITAYHEGGHALVARYTEGAHPLYKATIIPRGSAGGMTMLLPEGDVLQMTRQQLLAQLDVTMGGRVAEEIVFGPRHITTGAHSDFQSATGMATGMVTQWGMSDTMGPVVVDGNELPLLGPELRTDVDAEVRSLLDEAYDRATRLVRSRRHELDRLAEALLEHETLDREGIERALQ